MIVKCDQCQARFKIPDEKVTEKGVKVRCTKCQHTFRVRRQGADAVNEPVTGSQPIAPADPFAAFGTAPPVSPDQATRPITLGHGLAGGSASHAPGLGLPPARPDPLDDPFEQKTRVARIPTELFEQASAKADPPSRRAPLPDPFGLPPESAPSRPSAPPRAPVDPFALPPEPAGFGDADPFALPPDRKPASRPSAPPRPAAADPFALPPEPRPSSRPPSRPSRPPAPSPFGADEQTAQGMPGFADPFAAGDADVGGPSGLELDGPPRGGASDPRAMFEMPPAPSRPPVPAGAPTRELLPDVGGVEERTETGVGGPPSGAVTIGRIGQPRAPAPSAAPERGAETPATPGAARTVSGVVVNVLVAAVLLFVLAAVGSVYLNEGKFDPSALSPARLSERFAASRTKLEVVDVSNGLYETRAGKPVFFVRGEVVNRSEQAAKVRVRAEILDGSELLRSAEAPAGGVPSPEDLHEISDEASLEALSGRLAKAAVELPPGGKAPFLVAFYAYPPDLAPYRLRVTPVVAGSEPAAKK